MAINDFLSGLLVAVGLKKSERRKLEGDIERGEARVRELFDKMEEHISQIRVTEARLRELKEKFEKSANAVKNAYALQIRSLMNVLRNSQEARELIAREIDKENALLCERRIVLEKLLHPTDTEEIETLAEDKREVVSDIRDEDKAIERLNKEKYAPKTADDEAEAEAPGVEVDYAELEKQMAELLDNPDSGRQDEQRDENKENKKLEEA